MSIMIQVRNVPEPLHAELVRRAEARGVTLTAYIQSVLEREVGRMPREEVLRRIRALRALGPEFDAAALIRADRGPLPFDE